MIKMRKEYQKPEVEQVSFITEEKITGSIEDIGGELNTESNTLFD